MAGNSTFAPGIAPGLSGSSLTVDQLVNPIDEIAPTLYGLVEDDQGYILPYLYSGGPTLNGPSVLYTEDDPALALLDPLKDVAPRAVGGSAENIGTQRGVKKLGFTESWSGYIDVTDEHVRWNRTDEVEQQFTAAANSFSMRFQLRAINQANAFLLAKSRTVTVPTKWNTAYTSGLVNIDPATKPLYSIALGRRKFAADKAGIVPDTLITHGDDALSLFNVYEDKLEQALASVGITNHVISDLQTRGQPILCKGGSIGKVLPEKPLDTVKERLEIQKTDRYVLDTSLAFIASNAYGAVILDGAYA